MRIKEAYTAGFMDGLKRLGVGTLEAFQPSHLANMFRTGAIGAPGAWSTARDQLMSGTLHKPGGMLHNAFTFRDPQGNVDALRLGLNVALPLAMGGVAVANAPEGQRGTTLGATLGGMLGSTAGGALGGVGATTLGTLGASAGAYLGRGADEVADRVSK
jgi:hypothetical protein